MKIAIDVREAGHEKTGKGWYTFNLVQEILKQDSHNQYLLYTDKDEHVFKADNVQMKVITEKSLLWHFKVLKDLVEEKVDLFFAPTSYIIPAFAPKSLRVIITVHDLVAFLFPGTHNTKAVIVERLTLKRAIKKAHSIFVVSDNTKKDLLEKFDYPERKIALVPCAPAEFYQEPLDPAEVEKFREQMQLPQKFILAVGTLEPRKNFSTLIKSFVIIKRKHPDFKLVIVGKKGWKYHQIEETLKKFELEKDVIFPGYLEDQDLKKMYALATVFVFPSLYEGFGIPPLEAMSCGCPVVSSNVASLPEVIGDAGLLIEPKNAHKLADAVCSLISNDQIRNMLIERGYRRSTKFSWKSSAKAALEVFEEIEKSPAKTPHFGTQPGTSLLVAVGLVTLIGLIAIGITNGVISSIRDSANVNHANEAFYAAEGALEEGLLANLNAGPGFSTASAQSVVYGPPCAPNQPPDPNNPNQPINCSNGITASYTIQGQVPEGKNETFQTGNWAGYDSIPFVGTGTVGQDCDPFNPTLTGFQYPPNDPNAITYDPDLHPCNWNKLSEGQKVTIPLYYTDANGNSINLFKANSELKLRIRVACANGEIFCATRPDLDYGTGNVNYNFDDPIVTWQITAEDADNNKNYSLLPFFDFNKLANPPQWKISASIITEKKINNLKISGNPVLSENSFGIDTNTNCRGFIAKFLSPNQDANFPCKILPNWSLQHIKKPVLTISVIGEIKAFQGDNLPYLEYQLLTKDLTAKPVDTVQTITAQGYSGSFKQILQVKNSLQTGLLEYVVQQ